MTARRSNELDSLIADITVDCYNDDEALTAFEAAFDNDAALPCPGTLIGEQVTVLSVGSASDRREPPSTSSTPTGDGTAPEPSRMVLLRTVS